MAKRSRGRPTGTGFHPTDEQRKVVEGAAGYGMPQDQIALLITNPATGKPIGETTLKEHFHVELQRGMVKANIEICQSLFNNATKLNNVAAQIWWTRARLGWKAASNFDEEPPAVPAEATQMDATEIYRRIAFALECKVRGKLPA